MSQEKEALYQIVYAGYNYIRKTFSQLSQNGAGFDHQLQVGGQLKINDKVRATQNSSQGKYNIGDTGVIIDFNEYGHPNIIWDKNGQKITANIAKVEVIQEEPQAPPVIPQGDLVAGQKVRATQNSSKGTYNIGDTGVIVDFDVRGNPNIKWDKNGETITANRARVEAIQEAVPQGNGNIKILDMTSTSHNIRSWNPVNVPRGTIFFRSASEKPGGIQGATAYNQTDDPRFYGDLDTTSRYMGDGKEMYMIMYDDMILADVSCLSTQVYMAYNEELKKKLDNYLRNDFGNAVQATMGTRVNPHNLLITKKGQNLKGYNNRSTEIYQDLPFIRSSDGYEGIEDRIKFLAFFITYGVCPVNQLETAINAYNFEVKQFKTQYGDKKIGNRDVNEVEQEWVQNWAGLNDLMLSDIACRNNGRDPPPGNLAGLSYRLSIGVLDDMACDFLKNYAKRFGVDGYYSFKQYVPWGPNRAHGRTEKFQFHSEICLFTPKEKVVCAVPLIQYAKTDPLTQYMFIVPDATIPKKLWTDTFSDSNVANQEMRKYFKDKYKSQDIFTTINDIIQSRDNSSDVTKGNIPRRLINTEVYTRIQDKIKGQPQRFGGKFLKKVIKLSTKNNKNYKRTNRKKKYKKHKRTNRKVKN